MAEAAKSPLIPVGAGIGIVSFFLPYVRSPELLGFQISRSGADIGGQYWVIPIACAVVLASHYSSDATVAPASKRTIMYVAAGSALAILLYAGMSLAKNRFLGVSALDVGVRPGMGAFGSFLGLCLVLVGALMNRSAHPVAPDPAFLGPAPASSMENGREVPREYVGVRRDPGA